MADRDPHEQVKHQPDKDREQEHPLPSTAHAVRLTQSWTPALARHQSWTPEDRKRDSQMGAMGAPLPEGYSQVSERH